MGVSLRALRVLGDVYLPRRSTRSLAASLRGRGGVKVSGAQGS